MSNCHFERVLLIPRRRPLMLPYHTIGKLVDVCSVESPLCVKDDGGPQCCDNFRLSLYLSQHFCLHPAALTFQIYV